MAESITDVPKAKVGEVVQDFVDFDDPQEVTVIKQPDGNYTITPS
jgi:hypothetical protein